MDVRIEASPMLAMAEMPEVIVGATLGIIRKAFSLVERVASFSCPSVSGHSISAVAPDKTFMNGGLAWA